MAGFILSVVFGALVFAATTNGYEYWNQDKWSDEFPACAGNQQSPIHLRTAHSTPLEVPTDLRFINYNQKYDAPVIMKNNNYTVDIVIPTAAKRGGVHAKNWAQIDNSLPKITGGLLGDDEYVVEALHFHWALVNGQGSEHLMDGVRGSLEMHIVHRNMKYPSLPVARDEGDGIAVLGAMFKAAPENPDVPGLWPITNNLDKVRECDSSFDIKDEFSLGKLLQDFDLGQYFTYKGSLTTPPCSEAVTWNFFGKVLPIAMQQMSGFRNTLNCNGQPIRYNYRRVQPLNDRPVNVRTPNYNRSWYKVVNDL